MHSFTEDLLRSAPIRIFIFDNRVEIVSPGALAGGLTIEDIYNGKTYQRNPFMAVFATNALRYRGIGSGIVRILEENKNITFENDDNGKEFKAIVWREVIDTQKSTQKSTQKRILDILLEKPETSRSDLSSIIGISEAGIKKQLAKMKSLGLIKRVGPDKGGLWEIITDKL